MGLPDRDCVRVRIARPVPRRAAGVSRGRVRNRHSAFTLLEILLALALLGFLSAALISAGTHLADARPRTPTEIFWEAARTARRAALKSEREVRLSFDEKEKRFLVSEAKGQQAFPVGGPRELSIEFLPAQSTGGALLIGGQLVEMQTLSTVSFYPDGTCSPFRVQIRTTGPAQVIAIDPWTCAAVLAEKSS